MTNFNKCHYVLNFSTIIWCPVIFICKMPWIEILNLRYKVNGTVTLVIYSSKKLWWLEAVTQLNVQMEETSYKYLQTSRLRFLLYICLLKLTVFALTPNLQVICLYYLIFQQTDLQHIIHCIHWHWHPRSDGKTK